MSKFTQYTTAMDFRRPVSSVLDARLCAPVKQLQILAGPRQVGKSTLVQQTLAQRPVGSCLFLAADRVELTSDLPEGPWLPAQWQRGERQTAAWQQSGHPLSETLPFVLVIDEVQVIPHWSALVKGLWDSCLLYTSPSPRDGLLSRMP